MSTAPLASACSRMPVLPKPCRCTAGRPEATRVWVTISPSTYDSVKRFEPTTRPGLSGAAGHASAPASKAVKRRVCRTIPTYEMALRSWLDPGPCRTLDCFFTFAERACLLPPFAAPSRVPRAAPQSASGTAEDRSPMTQLKAFIVEDSPVIRENLVAALEEMAPIRVVGNAEDEASAVGWLARRENQCDLVV